MVLEQRLACGCDVIEVVAAQQDGDVVALENGVVRIAREAAFGHENRLSSAPVERQMRLRLCRHAVGEVREAPRYGDAEPGRIGRVGGVELAQCLFEIVLRGAEIVHGQRRGDDLAVQRRHDHLDPFALDAAQVEDMLLGRHGAGDRARRSGRQLVDELVDARAAERGGGRAPEKTTPREPHQPSGRTSTSPASNRSRFFTTWRYVYGLITCSLML